MIVNMAGRAGRHEETFHVERFLAYKQIMIGCGHCGRGRCRRRFRRHTLLHHHRILVYGRVVEVVVFACVVVLV